MSRECARGENPRVTFTILAIRLTLRRLKVEADTEV
jgi:hypothetical protein